MKKFLVALLSTAMVVSCCNVAWAADDTLSGDDVQTIFDSNLNGTIEADEKNYGTDTAAGTAKSSKDVSVTLTKDKVYSIDVTWDSMNIPYNYGTWTRHENDSLSYEGGKWSTSNNSIVIKNYSNASVKWGASFVNSSGKYSGVTGKFNSTNDENGTELSSATIVSADTPNSPDLEDTTYLILSGAPANDAVDNEKVGTATITITTP